MQNISNLFYFQTTLYMFHTVFPSIIRNLRLYTQHRVCHTGSMVSADFVIPYSCVGFVKFFDVSVLAYFFCLFGIDLYDIYLMLYVQS